jgi:hypothetical protein
VNQNDSTFAFSRRIPVNRPDFIFEETIEASYKNTPPQFDWEAGAGK